MVVFMSVIVVSFPQFCRTGFDSDTSFSVFMKMRLCQFLSGQVQGCRYFVIGTEAHHLQPSHY